MSVVGRAYVTVRAVTRQVPGDVKGGVEKAIAGLDDKLGQQLGDKLGAGIGDGIAGSGVDKSITDSINKVDAGGEGDKLGKKVGDSIMKGVASTGIAKGFEDEFNKPDYESDGSRIGQRLGDAIGKDLFGSGKIQNALRDAIKPNSETDRSAMSFGDRVMTMAAAGMILKAPALLGSAMILPLAQVGIPALSQLTAAAGALASTLGPVLAAGAGVGATAVLGLASAVATVSLAFKSNKDRVAELVSALGPVRDQWRGIAGDIQDTLFPAVEGAAARITDALGPTLRGGLTETAGAVGSIATQFARLSESADFQDNLGQVMNSNAVSLRLFGRSGVDAVDMLVRLGAAAAPLTQRFAQFVQLHAASAAASLEDAQNTGALADFFDRAAVTTEKWGSVLGNTAAALGHIFSLGSGPGGQLLDMLDGVTERFNDWTKSAEGASAISGWFASAVPIVRDLGDVLGGLTEGLGNFVGDGAAVHLTLSGLADILPDIGTALGAFSASLGGIMTILPPIAAGLAQLAPAWSEAGDAIWNNLAPAIHDLIPSLESLLESALKIVEAFAPTLRVFGQLAQIVGAVIAPAFAGLAAVLEHMPGPVMAAVGSLIALRLALNAISNSRFAPAMSVATSSVGKFAGSVRTAGSAGAALRTATSGIVGALGGPWMLAVTGAVTAIGLYSQHQAEMKGKVEELTGSLNQQTGAITKNTYATALGQLENDGWVKTANNMGISSELLIQAIQGVPGAMEKVTAAAKVQDSDWNPFKSDSWTNDSEQLISHVQEVKGRIEESQASWDRTTGAMDRAGGAAKRVGDSIGGTVDVVGRGGRSVDEYGNAIEGVGRASGRAAGAQRDLTRATIAYQQATAAAIGGRIGLEQAIDDATKALRENKHTLDINSQAGRDNMQALLDVAGAAGKVTGSADKQQAAMERARKKIITTADAMGYNRQQAVNLADSLLKVKTNADKIPPKKEVKTSAPGMEGVINSFFGLDRAINGIDRNVTVNVKYNYMGGHHDPTGELSGGSQKGSGRATVLGPRGGGAGAGARAAGSGGGSPSFAGTGGTSAAAASARAAVTASGGTIIEHQEVNYHVTVVNPTTERTSDSIPRAMRRTRDLGITAGEDGGRHG